jgi:serine/threonine-protein kinase RsbW
MGEPHSTTTMGSSAVAPAAAPANAGRAAMDGGAMASPSLLSPLARPDEESTVVESVRITIPSRAEYVRVVRLAILGMASRMAFSYNDVEDIKLAVSEACNNAILHADAATQTALAAQTISAAQATSARQDIRRRSFITVTLTPWPDRLEISIADEGYVPPPGLTVPPSPSARQNVPDDELKESGLGLFLMEALMDAVEHQTGADSNTVVCMVKYTRNHFTSNTSA